MASEAKVARIKKAYEASPKLWTDAMVFSAVEDGTITAADYATITGKTYQASPIRSVIIKGGSLSETALNWGEINGGE